MMRRSTTLVAHGLIIALLGLLSTCPPALAKEPTLTGFFPAGAARGQTLTVTASGTFDHWPPGCWVNGPGLSIKPEKDKGKFTVQVAPDAKLGVHWIRLHDKDGATGLRAFLIGGLPEVMESEPNNDPRRPQVLDKPSVTVNGRLERSGDVDGYAVKLQKGETLAADLEANHRLGSPMDAVLQVASADGFVLEQNNDSVGNDPRILFKAPKTGTFIVRVFAFPSNPDSTIRFAGGKDYVYRLTITTGGFIDHAFPLGVSGAGGPKVGAVGANLSAADSALVVPLEAESGSVWIPDRLALTHPEWAGWAEVRRVNGTVAIEVEPNGLDRPQPLSDRSSISGRIDPPGDRDVYEIALKKGEDRRFRVESRAFGLPLDATLQLLDAKGKVLVESDDVDRSSDPALSFSPPADGTYRLVVRDLNRRGSPRHAYLLSVTAPEPDFHLKLAADTFTATPGKETKVVVQIDRKDGFNGMIEVRAEDLPKGVSVKPVRSRKGDFSSLSVNLMIQAEAGAASGAFRIVGQSAEGKGPTRPALAKITGFETELATDRPWLTVLAASTPPSSAPAKPKKP